MTSTTPSPEGVTALVERLTELLAKAEITLLIADTHHTKDYAGRIHGWLRNAGELVPVAGFVLGVDGMPQDQGRARLELAAAAINALPTLLTALSQPIPTMGEEDLNQNMHDDQPFIDAWATMERQGYMYGDDALENVHLGWKLARLATSQREGVLREALVQAADWLRWGASEAGSYQAATELTKAEGAARLALSADGREKA